MNKKIIVIFGISSGIGNHLFKNFSSYKNLEIIGFTSKREMVQKNVFFYQYGKVKVLKKIFNGLFKQKKKIHLIICNGTNGEVGRLEKIDLKNFISTFNINFFSIVEILHNYLKIFKKQKKFVLLFSGGGAFSNFPKFDSYACSKTALVRLVENLSAEYKSELQINAIAPGFNFTRIQKDLLKNNSSKDIGSSYYKFVKKNKNKKNNFNKIESFIYKTIFDRAYKLSGKTVSINFDKWDEVKFYKKINIINKSDYMCLRRINKKPF